MQFRLTLCAGLIAVASSAFGQAYPSRPITFVVPWPAGGNSDFTARVLGTELARQLARISHTPLNTAVRRGHEATGRRLLRTLSRRSARWALRRPVLCMPQPHAMPVACCGWG